MARKTLELPMQLDFFEDYNELYFLKKDIDDVRISSEKVRKGIFARHNELAKLIVGLSTRLELIEKNLTLKT